MFPNYYTNEQIVLSKEYKEIAIELDKIEEEYIECISNKAIDECNELKYQLNEIQKQLNDILEENIWKLN